MPDPLKIAVFADTKGAVHHLQEFVRLLGHQEAGTVQADFRICIENGALAIYGADEVRRARLPLPSRAGKILNFFRSCLQDQTLPPRTMAIGTYSLDTYDYVMSRGDGGEEIRLTEKEVAILSCLFKAQGGLVSRQTLLDEVWGYAQNVETHTLETHIYRLRQKIEKDPSDPRILRTEEDGYSLAL